MSDGTIKTGKSAALDKGLLIFILSLYALLIFLIAAQLFFSDVFFKISLKNRKIEASAIAKQALALASKAKYREALDKFDEALSVFPQFPEALTNKGVVYLKLGDLNKAEKAFKKSLSLNPIDSSNIYANLSDLYRLREDSLKEIEFARLAAKSALSPVGKFKILADCFYRRLDWKSALAEYENEAKARLNLANYARYAFEKAVRERAENLKLEGKKLAKIPSFEEVLKIAFVDKKLFERQLNRDKALAVNLNKIGICLAKLGEYKEALKSFKEALSIWENFSDAKLNARYVQEKLRYSPKKINSR